MKNCWSATGFLPAILTSAALFGTLACGSATPHVVPFCGLRSGMTESEFLQAHEPLRRQPSLQKCGERALDTEEDALPPTSFGDVATFTSGMLPRALRSVRIDDNEWAVWSYRVVVDLSPGLTNVSAGMGPSGPPVTHHREYVVFKNQRLIAWGLGYPSRAILNHPDQVVTSE